MRLTCIAGLPGTGKTRTARRLEAETGAVRISRDELRLKLFDPPDLSDEEKTFVFRVMLALAEYHLRQGRDVVLDGMPFSRRLERDAARRLALDWGAEFKLLHCVCPDEVALQRIRANPGSHPAADRSKELYFRVKNRFEPLTEDENAVVISTHE